MTFEKDMLVDAIAGTHMPMAVADKMTQLGLARFTGNQWNEDWEWDKRALDRLDVPELSTLYRKLKLGIV